MKNGMITKLKSGENQIICFPYLGGYSSAFLNFASTINSDIEVWAINPPAHSRSNLKLLDNLDSLIELYYKEIKGIIKRDSIFFGHSMGGIGAYFLLQKFIQLNEIDVENVTLVLSACNIPDEFKTNNYSKLNDKDLIDHLITYGGIPEELLKEKSLLEYFLPVFRADFKILEDSANLKYYPLKNKVYFMWGECDDIVPINAVFQWDRYFLSDIELIIIKNGQHMFIYDKATDVVNSFEEIINKNMKNLTLCKSKK
ncbi:MAG: thioesterase domain-containing protein [Clostridiales bacterium]